MNRGASLGKKPIWKQVARDDDKDSLNNNRSAGCEEDEDDKEKVPAKWTAFVRSHRQGLVLLVVTCACLLVSYETKTRGFGDSYRTSLQSERKFARSLTSKALETDNQDTDGRFNDEERNNWEEEPSSYVETMAHTVPRSHVRKPQGQHRRNLQAHRRARRHQMIARDNRPNVRDLDGQTRLLGMGMGMGMGKDSGKLLLYGGAAALTVAAATATVVGGIVIASNIFKKPDCGDATTQETLFYVRFNGNTSAVSDAGLMAAFLSANDAVSVRDCSATLTDTVVKQRLGVEDSQVEFLVTTEETKETYLPLDSDKAAFVVGYNIALVSAGVTGLQANSISEIPIETPSPSASPSQGPTNSSNVGTQEDEAKEEDDWEFDVDNFLDTRDKFVSDLIGWSGSDDADMTESQVVSSQTMSLTTSPAISPTAKTPLSADSQGEKSSPSVSVTRRPSIMPVISSNVVAAQEDEEKEEEDWVFDVDTFEDTKDTFAAGLFDWDGPDDADDPNTNVDSAAASGEIEGGIDFENAVDSKDTEDPSTMDDDTAAAAAATDKVSGGITRSARDEMQKRRRRRKRLENGALEDQP